MSGSGANNLVNPMEVGNLWGKTRSNGVILWHPLLLHMLDVAACADAIMTREPTTTRERMGRILGKDWEEARGWILLLIACHDLGKACPGFQCKWEIAESLLSLTGLRRPAGVDISVHHAFVSQVALTQLLRDRVWPIDLAELAADAVGCHHGERAHPSTVDRLEGNRRAMGDRGWADARLALFDALIGVLRPGPPPTKESISGPDFMLLAGLASFSDWIGSNEDWFPFGTKEDCEDLDSWWGGRREQANLALKSIGWEARVPLSSEERSFEDVFKFPPRPLQQAVSHAVQEVPEPCILLLEAPMGEGKTEAAFYTHLELQRRFGHRGLYIALPTKATGNAMFARTLKFLKSLRAERVLDLQLLHGSHLLNETFRELKLSSIHNSEGEGNIRAGEWFTRKKRALLSEYGVGTVDQALLPILPVRHNFVRLWGLANRMVVFDEIHAYDAYTGTLLIHLLRWLLSMGSSIVLLSATLPPAVRRKLAQVVSSELPDGEAPYPRLSIFRTGTVKQVSFEADPGRRRMVRLEGIQPDVATIRSALEGRLEKGGMGLALVNTVQRAQDLYRCFPDGEPLTREGWRIGKRLPDGTEVFLFHARFPADRRQRREENALTVFGEEGVRDGRKILIATQVVEQSLDLDFDLIVTDLAPIDLVLQRAGRLWRHTRDARPVMEPYLLVAGLCGDEPPLFGKPLWWGKVYREDILLRTWCLIRPRKEIVLPDEIDALVQAVYEEQINVVDSLQERMEKALSAGEGEKFARSVRANQAFIGFPDDRSWDDPARYSKADDDEPGLHPTLVAQTRMGEPSVVAIPLFPQDDFDPDQEPDFDQAKVWFLRAMSLSRKALCKILTAQGVPNGWKKSSLLRNCHALVLDAQGRWKGDVSVRLDDDLGLVYGSKEGS
jgi:CRISPR-associated endonuclease/helicase Cas3